MIVCWRHNWKECPAEIEVVELCRVVWDEVEPTTETLRHGEKGERLAANEREKCE
jgi:hypothetical protein